MELTNRGGIPLRMKLSDLVLNETQYLDVLAAPPAQLRAVSPGLRGVRRSHHHKVESSHLPPSGRIIPPTLNRYFGSIIAMHER